VSAPTVTAPAPDTRPPERRDDRRRFVTAAVIGAGLAMLVFVVVLLDGHATPFRVVPPQDSFGGHLSQFYDVQAHSLLDLRWSVPPETLGIEGFRMDDGTYMYFGPWPAFLRLPIAAVTHSFDGRLTQPSMFLAFVVALAFTIRLAWRVRTLVMPERAVRRGEQWAVGGFLFVVGAGSVLVFLAAKLEVWNEAALWGVALAIGAFDAIVDYTVDPRGRMLAWASLLTALTLFSRPPLGIGPLAALGVLAAVAVIGRGGGLIGMPAGKNVRRQALPLAAAVLIPLSLYVALNLVKFDTAFSLPFDRQVVTEFSPGRQAVLKANDGSLVGSQFIPTNLVQYFRPDAISFTGRFPYVDFPGPADVVGSVRFDWVTPATSVPASMPFLTVLAIGGIVIVVLPRTAGRLRAFRAPLAGAVIASAVTLGFGFVANRYIADFVPVLVLLALAGFFTLLARSEARPGTAVRVAWVGVGVLGVLSVWFSTGLALAWQQGLETPVLRAQSFPRITSMGTMLVIGDCDGLYRSTGTQWRALELTPTTGRYRVAATFPSPAPVGEREPLVVSGPAGREQAVFVEYLAGDRVAFGYVAPGSDRIRRGPAVPLAPGAEHTVDVLFEPNVAQVQVKLDDAIAFDFVPASLSIVDPVERATVGRNDRVASVRPEFTGTIRPLETPTPNCRKLQRSRPTS
jgi:hypothetical protein